MRLSRGAAGRFTSGLRSRVGSAHSRLRLEPTALVRRWPRQVPSGFMFGTCPHNKGCPSHPGMLRRQKSILGTSTAALASDRNVPAVRQALTLPSS